MTDQCDDFIGGVHVPPAKSKGDVHSTIDRSFGSLHFDRSIGTTADDRLTVELNTGDA